MFKEIPAIKRSIALRRPVFGIATNNADYMVIITIDGKRVSCPFYKRWNHMLERCYSEKFIARNPSYNGCTTCDEWLTFSNFKEWMKKQDWQGKQLDKDLKYTDNKIYSPDTCIFVPQQINALLTDHRAARGNDPQGVILDERTGRFQSKCCVNGKRKHLGMFATSSQASDAYKQFKSQHVYNIAMDQDEPLRGYLIRISGEYLA